MRRVRRFVLLILVLALSQPAAWGQSDTEHYRRLAVDLVHQAGELLDQQPEAALDLARRAVEIDPSLGDARYLSARALAETGAATGLREDHLRVALSLELVSVERLAVVEDLAPLLVLHGRAREALTLLDEEIRSATGQPPLQFLRDRAEPGSSRDLDYAEQLYLQALVASGPPWFVGTTLEELWYRYPRQEDLAALVWRRQPRVSLALLEWLDAARAEGRRVDPEILGHAVTVADQPAMVQTLTERYYAAGGTDPRAALHAYLLAGRAPDEGVEEALRRDKTLWEDVGSHLARPDEDDLIQSTVQDLEEMAFLRLVADRNRDGAGEAVYTLRNGVLLAWQGDQNQDGEAEQAVIWDGETTMVLQLGERSTRLVEYGPYPLVFRVSEMHDGALRQWRPAQPVPFEALGQPESYGELWNVLTRRVSLSPMVGQRFDRQLSTATAMPRESDEYQRVRAVIDRWERVQ